MSEEQIKLLWGRVDEHGKAIIDLTVEQKSQANLMQSQEKRFDRFIGEQERSRAEIIEAIRGHHEIEGVKHFLKGVLPWLIAAGVFLTWLIKTATP